MPKVSIVIPVYNVEKYLRQCLDSVVNQTLQGIEIICVNDGSKDSSSLIAHEYEEKYPHDKKTMDGADGMADGCGRMGTKQRTESHLQGSVGRHHLRKERGEEESDGRQSAWRDCRRGRRHLRAGRSR